MQAGFPPGGQSRDNKRGVEASLALGNPDQAVAGDDGTFGDHRDIAKANQLCQMRRRYLGVGRGYRDFDQRGELFGRQKLWRMNGHR